jgi:hypothetical protein
MNNIIIGINLLMPLSVLLLHLASRRRLAQELQKLTKYKEETDHKLEILIKVSHRHEQYIDSLKQKADELLTRNRRNGVR